MPTIVRLAKTSGELNDVLEMRYHTLTDSGRTLSSWSHFTERILDHLDIYPTTLNVIAYHDGKAVAGLRAARYSPNERLLNLGFDFSESAANVGGVVYAFDMVAFSAALKSATSVRKHVLKMALSLLAHQNINSALFLCPEPLLALCEALGFKRLKDPYVCNAFGGATVCPLIIDVAAFFSSLVQGIVDQEIIRFQEVFYYSIFAPGEVMVVEGERGSTAYLIEEGEVEVLVKKGDAIVPISSIGQGRMIGEVAMVTNEPRTASLVARSTTACISFDRNEFMKLMYAQPHRSMDIFKIFSKRLSESNKRIAEMKQ